MKKDIANDEEYLKYQEEQTNTKKMSTILKSLNHPVFVKNSISRAFNKRGAQSLNHHPTGGIIKLSAINTTNNQSEVNLHRQGPTNSDLNPK